MKWDKSYAPYLVSVTFLLALLGFHRQILLDAFVIKFISTPNSRGYGSWVLYFGGMMLP
jgi:hypothetical protein